MNAFVAGLVVAVLLPLLWSALLLAARHGLGRERAAPQEGAEKILLALLIAPVPCGLALLALAALAPQSRPWPLVLDRVGAALMLPSPEAVERSALSDVVGVTAQAAVLVYGVGALLLLGRFLLARRRVRRIARQASPAGDAWGAGVKLTHARISPFAAGRGEIILPRGLLAQLSPAATRMIVRHEKAHLERRDPAYYTLLALIEVALWFNPLVRRQVRRCRLAAELVCDEAATCGARELRRAYAQSLVMTLKYAAGGVMHGALSDFSPRNEGEYRMRIEAILRPAPRPTKRPLCTVLIVALALGGPMIAMQAEHAGAAAQAVFQFTHTPVKGQISSPFGAPGVSSSGKQLTHGGVDILAEAGSPVVAPAAGHVTRAERARGGYGDMLEIDHGDGLVSRYGHLGAFAVMEGDSVRAGQIIARVGTTGAAAGKPHLYFEVLRDGQRIDPASLIPL